MSNKAKIGIIAAVVLTVLFFSSFYTIKSGTVGVISTLGKFSEEEVLPGAHFKIPFVQTVYVFDTKLHTVNYDLRTKTPEELGQGVIDRENIVVLDDKNLSVDLDVSVQFKPKPEEADAILKKYGENYFEKLINPRIRNVVRDVVGQYQAETISLRRNELGQELLARVRKNFEDTEIIISNVAVRNIRLPEIIKKKAEAVQTAKQEEQRLAMVEQQAQRNQMIKKIDAETRFIEVTTKARAAAEQQKIAADAKAYALLKEAKAQAEANRLISQSISAPLIRYRQIEKWNGTVPQTIVGDGGADVLVGALPGSK